MRKKLILLAAMAALGAGLLALQSTHLSSATQEAAASATPKFTPYEKQKAVYQVSKAGGWFDKDYKRILGIAENHMNALGPENLDLRIILSGEGLGLLRDAKSNAGLAEMVHKLKLKGAQFLVCSNTLASQKIDPARDLYDVAPQDIVRAGIAEITKLQLQGFAYVQP